MDNTAARMDLGNKLKELRNKKGLTQEELADRCELSKGFISQLENDLTSPSIATLMDILQCLGTSLQEFFRDAGDEQIVFGRDDFFEKTDAELHNKIEWIIPNAQKNKMEPIRVTLETVPLIPTSPTKGKNSAMYSPAPLPLSSATARSELPKGTPSISRRTRNTIFGQTEKAALYFYGSAPRPTFS